MMEGYRSKTGRLYRSLWRAAAQPQRSHRRLPDLRHLTGLACDVEPKFSVPKVKAGAWQRTSAMGPQRKVKHIDKGSVQRLTVRSSTSTEVDERTRGWTGRG